MLHSYYMDMKWHIQQCGAKDYPCGKAAISTWDE